MGHYSLVSLLGAGGMGAVYLAHDKRLYRKVAIKVLPGDFTRDPTRVQRFQQEARAASALNHPNIVTIYEIDEVDGTHFIAMEYIDGATLRKKIHDEKVPLNKLLQYLAQAAEGLAKAHLAGIVHRDLKPDNIMITCDGYAKVLDFGLAKLIEPQKELGLDSGSSEVATAILPQHSLPGMIMGTVGYMSPEQAQGRVKEIDHRSDIFSFGCILYEAATRVKAFAGKDVLDSLHMIVHAPTPQVKDVNPAAPGELQRIVRRCLAKEPDKRYQSIKDVATELDDLRQELKGTAESEYAEPQSGNPGSITQSGAVHSTSSAEYVVSAIKSHKRAAGIVAVALLLTIGAISLALYKLWPRSDLSLPSIKVERLTTSGKPARVAISPDGKYVVYALDEGGQQSLWGRQVATSGNFQIIPPADTEYRALAFTPDGNYINLVTIEKNSVPTLYQKSLLGGTPKKVLANVDGAISYSPDGRQFAFLRNNHPQPGTSALLIANADGTGERILALRKRPEAFAWWAQQNPSWSPDGKTIACVIGRDTLGSGPAHVAEVHVADGTLTPITTKGWYDIRRVAWLQDKGGLLILAADQAPAFNAQQIWHISYPGGEARRITTDIDDYVEMSLSTDSKSLVAVQSNTLSNIWIVPNLDASQAVQIKSGGDNQEGVIGLSWTPDGRIVFHSLASGTDDIWIMNGDGSDRRQLTNESANYDLKVTPDGRYIVFTSERTGAMNLWRMDLDGGNPKQLTSGESDYGAAITPDSEWVIYNSSSSGKPALWKVSIDGGNATQISQQLAGDLELSPDGKWIATQYRERAATNWRYALIPFEGGDPIKVFDLPGSGQDVRWAPDGRSLMYRDTRDGVTNIWNFPLDGGSPKQLTEFKTDYIYNFKWSPDGKKLVLARGTTTSNVVLIRDFK